MRFISTCCFATCSSCIELFPGNIVVLIVFAYSKRMRTRTNLFLANLAAADFCVGVFCVLPNLSINLSPVWRLGRVSFSITVLSVRLSARLTVSVRLSACKDGYLSLCVCQQG